MHRRHPHSGLGGDRGSPPSQLQNPNMFVHNPNMFQLQSPVFNNTLFTNPNLNFPFQNPAHHFSGIQSHPTPKASMDQAVIKSHKDAIEAGESVSAWKVSQKALFLLHADSWDSLGLRMQEVPSLNCLMATEGKINAFIHCFVGVRRITSLYELEVSICKNEGVEQFEDLKLGPLMRHPLITHYFSLGSDASEVVKITGEEVVSYLCELLDSRKKGKIEVGKFLDFIAKKKEVGRENLGVRIQSLGFHISCIIESRKIEDMTLKKCFDTMKHKSNKKRSKKRPLFSSQKKQLDERFSAIHQRINSFSSAHKDFRGKHVIFNVSSSEIDSDDDNEYQDTDENCVDGQLKSLKNTSSCDRVSRCPYPSATEEITRLGLNVESDTPPSGSESLNCNDKSESLKRKRKYENSAAFNGSKFSKRAQVKCDLAIDIASNRKDCNKDDLDHSVAYDSVKTFIATWKEACRNHDASEVFERMVQFYKFTGWKRKRLKLLFLSNPFIGLLNVAVASIKYGMWDSIYDTFQDSEAHGINLSASEINSEYEKIDVEPSEKDAAVYTKDTSENTCNVALEDIVSRIKMYFELENDILLYEKSILGPKFLFLKKICCCESWIEEQFSVKKFRSLGYGDFFTFLEKYASLLPGELHKCFIGECSNTAPLEVSMLHDQLIVFLSQASNNLWENEIISKQKISELLMRQFPLLSFNIKEYGPIECFSDIVREQESSATSRSVIFSLTLIGSCYNVDFSVHNKEDLMKTELKIDIIQQAGILGHVTSKNAIDVLRKAPMLSDLISWSHWDLIYAPSLGSLVQWLVNEGNAKELLCLVTKEGKIIRIDNSATVDSFLKVSLQGSAFDAAVQLLSLFSLFGGIRHVPLALLKSHTRKVFEVIFKNYKDNDTQNSFVHDKASWGLNTPYGHAACKINSKQFQNLSRASEAVSYASRFILECLTYLPSEFRGFATEVLLSGLQFVSKDAVTSILFECNLAERCMLHELGLSLGIVQWIDDYHVFCSTTVTDLSISSGASRHKIINYEFSTESSGTGVPFEGKIVSAVTSSHNDVLDKVDGDELLGDMSDDVFKHHLSELSEDSDAAMFIESIRREEFGLDPRLSRTDNIMLEKQHARLGRALHCLSQELYSQDSHFLLELVQNADDNIYPENVEPTLIFIIRDEGIIILNNERGFSAQNIRALCDVGNSTKKGLTAGYIGQKGIGFKSVFRVTDAPEIHSNGFHVKFDISEGQIGFVLPTLVLPCDVNSFISLLYSDTDKVEQNCWNTCIVLPFRSKLSGASMNNIISMFSDLHPSLLLFLHRLQCIKFRNMFNGSLDVMRKEIMEDGIIKVSHGKEKMTWFVISQKLQDEVIRPDVQTTEISIAFTLKETDNGNYSPQLDQQPVFAFLPLRTYGLKFILQGDFILPSSREEVDGNSPWNQWLLSEFPALFVGAERPFCSLSCFRENPGKAVAAYMSFVPLVGEVHGFFSSLPRMIISKLCMSNCLLVEGNDNKWVLPCNVLRNWDIHARSLLPDNLLHDHGLGFLDKDIVLSDPLAKALGIEEYGPKILLQVMKSLCQSGSGLKSMGLDWLCSWINTLYTMLLQSSAKYLNNFGMELDIINILKKIPFIPLSDGTFSAVNEGTIWIQSSTFNIGFDSDCGLGVFPNLSAKLRTVSPTLLSTASSDSVSMSTVDHLTKMFHKIGIQELTAHEILKVQILPAITNDRITVTDKNLMTEYLSFIMTHLQSSCTNCHLEKDFVISELRDKAFIMTSHGCKRLSEVSLHFGKEYGNLVNVNKLTSKTDLKWHEVDVAYLKHPVTNMLPSGIIKWREFFKELGVTDFVHVTQVEKSVTDLPPTVFKNMVSDGYLISSDSVVRDWESHELVDLLSFVSLNRDRERSKYLLEVLDTMWDDNYSDKITGYCNLKSNGDIKTFKSSFARSICDIKWVASSVDDKIHCPQDLFHDCDTLCSILGVSVPYAVPKVRNGNFLNTIGFKTHLTLDDALMILQKWSFERPHKASITQMSKFYTFIWNEVSRSKEKIMANFQSGPFIFVPFVSGYLHHDIVSGIFLPPGDVFWHDSIGSMDQMGGTHLQSISTGEKTFPLSKILGNIYPGLHDFFVNECGVKEIPSFRSYLQFLLQLSAVSLPSQASNALYQIFLKWADGLKSGSASSEDIIYLKECLLQLEYTVIPTVQDKWVSLHPSFGLACWCDNENLKKEFKHADNIDFLYFGELSSSEKEIFQEKVSTLMQTLGIPTLSEVVSREVIFYGLADSSFKKSLVNWAIPYVQRYVYNVHPDKYLQLKLSGFEILDKLQVVVVEKLFYRNVIKRCGIISEKRYECSSLLQGSLLYTTTESDSHSVYMELSRLLFGGTPELHLANFLLMITTMAESGSTEEQTEFFIMNSQKIPKLPAEEPYWPLVCLLSLAENDETLKLGCDSTLLNDLVPPKSKRKPGFKSNWPPADWKTAPGFDYSRSNGLRTRVAITQAGCSSQRKEVDCDDITSHNINVDYSIDDNPIINYPAIDTLEEKSFSFNPNDYNTNTTVSVSDFPDSGPSDFGEREQSSSGTFDSKQAILTGRIGEQVAFKYFSDIISERMVTWVNQDTESGLPYDIVVEDNIKGREYIEVKATRSCKKDWLNITTNEWNFAAEMGEFFSIAHVTLSGNNMAKVTVFKNPVALCKQGKLQLILIMPRQKREVQLPVAASSNHSLIVDAFNKYL